MNVEIVHTHMPIQKDVYGTSVHNFDNSVKPSEHAIKVVAYTQNRELIDSGTPVDVHVPGHGVVSFRFTPTEDYPEAGTGAAVYTPFKEGK